MNFLRSLLSNIKTACSCLLSSFALVFWRDRRLMVLTYSGLVINGIAWGLFYWILSGDRAGIIVHYNAFLGIDIFLYLSDNTNNFIDIFLGPISGTYFFVVNIVIAILLVMFVVGDRRRKESAEYSGVVASSDLAKTYLFGSYIVLGGNIVLQLAIVIYVIAIAVVNY